jgi:DNA-directed RNA polymerase specialized sigma24 family protein
MTAKERIHALVDDLPEEEVHATLGFVEHLHELKGLHAKAFRVIAQELKRASYQETPTVVEDVFQDALLSMCRYYGKGRKPKSVSAYFLTVCRNAARRYLKKEIQVERSQRELESDPVLVALREAPLDDEPLTDEDLAALEEARKDVAQGRLISHDEVRRRFLGDQ